MFGLTHIFSLTRLFNAYKFPKVEYHLLISNVHLSKMFACLVMNEKQPKYLLSAYHVVSSVQDSEVSAVCI